MINGLCDELRGWVQEQLGESEVRFSPRPLPDDEGPAVVAWLFAIRPAPAHPEEGRTAYRATCRFLITAVSTDVRLCHEWVGGLLTAAMVHPSFEVEPGEPPAELWRSAALAPRPAFVLRDEAVARVDHPTAPLARTVVTVRAALAAMSGRVLGPAGTPLAGAEVRSLATGVRARTDREGRFALASVPAGRPHRIEVRAGRRSYAVVIEGTKPDEPIDVRLEAKE